MDNRKDFERFAAQYWNQEVAIVDDGGEKYLGFTGEQPHEMYNISWLLLRSIESLTDEELISIADRLCPLIDKIDIIRSRHIMIKLISKKIKNTPYLIEHLRHIGILVPFDKYSVEEILSMGWAVLKK